ncbi:MAG TPA: F0F1 ATP synthase subunit B [Candidatus Eisenbacteria bacterium]|nr:F0F1 ATP synthase subunit B [Candidatus Eisenbacteria bacterium]
MNLIDIRQVLTQVLGFLIMVWLLRRFAWKPVLGLLEARRQKIADEFEEAERRKAEAADLKARYELELRGIEAQARQRLQEAMAEGQKLAAELKSQAQADASQRMQQAADEIAREREKAKEILKEQMVALSVRAAEKILRQKIDDQGQRKLAGEFIDQVAALP